MNPVPDIYARTYQDIEILQHKNFESVVGEFLRIHQFTDILEIGTYHGGFALFVHNILPHSKIVTYDPWTTPHWLKNHNIDFRHVNPFSEDYSFVSTELVSFIANSKKLLVAVDGGNKIKEFNCIAPLLKSGNYMMCHDYAPTKEVFNSQYKGRVWDHCEIFEEDIQKVCVEYNLQTVSPELNSVLWQCKYKETV